MGHAGRRLRTGDDGFCFDFTSGLVAVAPFIHFFDGFRTSHEISKIEVLEEKVLRALIDDKLITDHRTRAMTPDKPVLRGTAQNLDSFFQGLSREYVIHGIH